MSIDRPWRPAFRLTLACVATAVIAACAEAPTEPTAPISSARVTLQANQDSTQCRHGWQLINGRYVCNE